MNDALSYANVNINGIHTNEFKKPLVLAPIESTLMFIGSYYKQTVMLPCDDYCGLP